MVTYLQGEILLDYKDPDRVCIHNAYRAKIATNFYLEQLHTLIISQHCKCMFVELMYFIIIYFNHSNKGEAYLE